MFINPNGHTIYNLVAPDSFPDLNQLFVKPLFVLMQGLGFSTLHASVVGKKGKYLFLLGPGGTGKSTLSGVLSTLGLQLLCDDLVFVKKIGRRFQIIPFASRLKFRNIAKKSHLGLSHLKLSIGTKPIFGNIPAFIFPRYCEDSKPKLRKTTPKRATLRLVKDNLPISTYCTDNKRTQKEILNFLCELGRQEKFFEVSYNDENLLETARLVSHKVLFDTNRTTP